VDVAAFLAQVAQSLGAEFQQSEDGTEFFLGLDTAEGRHQDVLVYDLSEEGRAYLRLQTAVGKAGELSRQRLTSLLELNASLLYGAFAIYQGDFILTHTLPLEGLEVDETARVIRYLGRMADTMEKMVVGLDRG
jgi:hypothetical protein